VAHSVVITYYIVANENIIIEIYHHPQLPTKKATALANIVNTKYYKLPSSHTNCISHKIITKHGPIFMSQNQHLHNIH
jgi:hypothetical protein